MIVLLTGCFTAFPAFLGEEEEEETIVDVDGDGWSPEAGDCDDADPDKHPEAADAWYDGFDVDCAGNDDYDQDGDGYVRDEHEASPTEGTPGTLPAGDCDDTSAAANPDADETCNEIDDNCDGNVDEATATDATTWYLDADADTYGDATQPETACEHGADRVPDATDCDDTHADANPDATELCDGYDNDCDSTIDEDDATDASVWYFDADGDEWGVAEDTRIACKAPVGYALNPGDCVDSDTRYNPGAAETDCADPEDYNCDGSTGYADADADGWAACEECDDAHADAFPGADELCDGYDNDCETDVDETDAVDASTWYADADGDKYGDPAVTTPACAEPVGYVADANDCDDTDLLEFPGANEYCDGDDDDCDSSVDEDEAIDVATWYADADSDGYGSASSTDAACDVPTGYVADATDCDDGNDARNPGEVEICDDLDNDCDGDVDEDAMDASSWYADADDDLYGDPLVTDVACDQPPNHVADGTDCDDVDAEVNVDAEEVCGDGTDNDCDGTDRSCTRISTDAEVILEGANDDYAGQTALIVDDVTGDGAADLLVGAHNADVSFSDGGAVYLVPGPASGTTALSKSTATTTYAAPAASDGYGRSFAVVPDADGDGYPELFIGAEWHGSGSTLDGAVYGHYMNPTVTGVVTGGTVDATADAAGDHLGTMVASVGYFTTGAVQEFAVGAYDSDAGATDSGAIYVLSAVVGGTGAVSNQASVRVKGGAASDKFGTSICAAGDIDGDGYPELLVGAAGADGAGSDAGAVYLLAGGTMAGAEGAMTNYALADVAERTFAGLAAGDAASACGTAGDNDFDGTPDILLGAPTADGAGTNSGTAYLLLGHASFAAIADPSGADATWSGSAAYDRLGIRLALSGDFDGDDEADVVITASDTDTGGGDSGSAWVFLGAQSGSLTPADADVTLIGAATNDQFGGGEPSTGDLDGDGLDDLALGAPYANTQDGAAYIFLGI